MALPYTFGTQSGSIPLNELDENFQYLENFVPPLAVAAATVTAASQPNITAVGNLSSLNCTGTITAGTLTAILLNGTLQTASQPNITQIGLLANLTVSNLISAATVAATGTVSAVTLTGTLSTAAQPAITSVGTLTSLSVTGNITGGNITAAGDISGNNLTFSAISASGNVIGANFLTGGLVSAVGNVTGGNLVTVGLATITGNVQAGNLRTSGLVSAAGNVTGSNVDTGGRVSATGNVDGANFLTTGLISAAGNVQGFNISATGSITSGAAISATGNLTAGNLVTTGLILATGNLTAGNLVTTGLILATGNVTGANLAVSGLVTAAGNVTGNNVTTAGLISATGNVTGGNIVTVGLVTATGNVTGNYFIGNGSQLTGTYGNTNVVANLAALDSNPISTTGNITTTNIVIPAGGKIIGDFSVGLANGRTVMQTSATNPAFSPTYLSIFPGPNNTFNPTTSVTLWETANTTFNNGLSLQNFSTEARIGTIVSGGDSYHPITIYNSNAEAARIDTSGNVGIANTAPVDKLSVGGNAYFSNNVTIAGNITGNVAGFSIGYRDLPQVSLTGNVSLAATDGGKHYYFTGGSSTQITVPTNVTVPLATGTAIMIVNQGSVSLAIAPAVGVNLYLAGNSTSATRNIGSYGLASLVKVATNTWFISGIGVS